MLMITVTQKHIDEATERVHKNFMAVYRNCVVALAIGDHFNDGSEVITGHGCTGVVHPDGTNEGYVHGKLVRDLIKNFDEEKPVEPGDYPIYTNYDELLRHERS